MVLYGLETLAIGRDTGRRQEAEQEVAELKMLRFSVGVTRMDRIRNKVRGTTQTGRLGEKAREARLDMCRGGTVETLVGEC